MEEFEKLQEKAGIILGDFEVNEANLCAVNTVTEKIKPKPMPYEPIRLTDEARSQLQQNLRRRADENGKVSFSGVSDGSAMADFRYVVILYLAGCTDIKTEFRDATADEIPKDRRFLTQHFEVSGILPQE